MSSYLGEELEKIQREIYKINQKNGWYDQDRSIGDEAALLHSEVSELFEELRIQRLSTEFIGQERKPVGAASEAADIFIRLMDLCHRYGIELAYEVETKLEYNRSRSYRHGGKVL